MKEILAIGFDLDNTLYIQDAEVDAVIQRNISEQVAQELSLDPQKTAQAYLDFYRITQSASTSVQKLGVKSPVRAKEIVQTALETANIAEKLKIDVQLVSMLERLSKNAKLFLITGSRENLAMGKLHALGLKKNIFSAAIYAESSLRRENGTAFEYIRDTLGVPYQNMVFIGDRESVDIVPANNLGIKTIMVNGTSKFATHNLSSIYQLEAILRN